MVNSNRGRNTYGLRIARYFRVQRLKIAIFTHGIVIVDPLAEECRAIYQRNLCIADSTVICFAVVASRICEITRNSEKIQTYSSSRSSKVIDLAANRKCICKFLLVINSNIGRISYRFRDIDT